LLLNHYNSLDLYQEGTRKVLLATLNKNPQTSWVKGPSGKHTNVSALLDWPDNSDESDSETMTVSHGGITLIMSSSGRTDSGGCSSVGAESGSSEVEEAGTSSPAADGKY
jgi:hypothetical protein